MNGELTGQSISVEGDNSLYPVVQIWVRCGLLTKVQGLKLESACLSNGDKLIAALASLGFNNTEPFIQVLAEEITTLLPKESHLLQGIQDPVSSPLEESTLGTNSPNGRSEEEWGFKGSDQTDPFKEMICSAESDAEYVLALQIAVSEWIKKMKKEGATEHGSLIEQFQRMFQVLHYGDLEGALKLLVDKEG